MPVQDLTPQLRTRLSRLEKWVGVFVTLATLLLLAGLTYYVYHTAERKGWFLAKAPYFVYLRTGTGLKVGDPVKLLGFPVGEITEITAEKPFQYDEDGNSVNVYVKFTVRAPNFGYIWSDSVVKVKSAGLLGDRYLEVTKGGGSVSVPQPFTANDLSDLPALVAKLGQPTDAVSRYLKEQLSKETQQALTNRQAPGAVSKTLQTALLKDLNKFMDDPELYDAQRFAGVTLRKETQKLLAEDPEGDDLLRLNRWLLEDAYPAEIAKYGIYSTYVEDKAHAPIQRLVRSTKQRPVPRGTYTNYFKNDAQCVYWLDTDEPPELSSQMDEVIRTAKSALPAILDLTNQLSRIFSNANNATVHLDELLVGTKPIVSSMGTASTNLTAITATLRDGKGALGEWLLPTNIQDQLVLLLPNLNSTVTNVNTNLVVVLSNVNASLENLAGIMSNLHAQVDVNTNILSNISSTVVHTDDLIQGLKRHWLLRSAFKAKPAPATNAPTRQPVTTRQPVMSPKGAGR